ncbi:hypothetical protein FW781_21195 [Chryseobacterium panacisoli]|uniref:Uncharacterized protein n=1 Tax=Chryseobacterium panacisoli TaxID=1807141 RepID=A0A5D8ZIS8_9FLAO|nr:hypothetical protein [Chryseobacterium panacisoli]TZF92554.1 hypothetical protein FW781_21195 [Chryseobacterium panacisoli]
MKRFVIFLLFSLMVTSCSKEQGKTKVIKNISDLNELFHLKNYKTQVRMKVNDSIDHITAQWHNFTLAGDFDTKMNNRTGIWTLKNKLDSKEVLIDYIIFSKGDAFKNQIIFKEHNKIDSSKSKFYIAKEKSFKHILLKFFSPKIEEEVSKEAKIGYRILRGSKVLKDDSLTYKNKKDGIYLTNIKFDFQKGDKLAGAFSEFVMAKNPKSKDSLIMGNNSIYFIERF